MPQTYSVEGEAVVIYREASTTQEIRYPNLCQRLKNRPKKALNKYVSVSDFLHGYSSMAWPYYILWTVKSREYPYVLIMLLLWERAASNSKAY